ALVSMALARSVTRPITQLTLAMDDIASDRFDIAVPGLARADELGAMASAVDVFRSNGIKMADLRSVERDMSRERAEQIRIIEALQQDIGTVVHAALEGDFSNRVGTELDDPELRRLADNVNDLLASVDRGLNETGAVLAALA